MDSWSDLINVAGIGAKTIDKIVEFCEMDDPFEIHKLHNMLESVRKALKRGELPGVPAQTHTSLEVPYSRGEDMEVVWAGVVVHKNLRELFEVNFSRTGVALDPAEVKDPHLNEWVILVGKDEDEMLTITVDRWKYPRFKRAIWNIKSEHDVLVVRGIKRGYQSRRAIYARDFWVVEPDE